MTTLTEQLRQITDESKRTMAIQEELERQRDTAKALKEVPELVKQIKREAFRAARRGEGNHTTYWYFTETWHGFWGRAVETTPVCEALRKQLEEIGFDQHAVTVERDLLRSRVYIVISVSW